MEVDAKLAGYLAGEGAVGPAHIECRRHVLWRLKDAKVRYARRRCVSQVAGDGIVLKMVDVVCSDYAVKKLAGHDGGRGKRVLNRVIAVVPTPLRHADRRSVWRERDTEGSVDQGGNLQPVDRVLLLEERVVEMQLGVVLVQRLAEDRVRAADQLFGEGAGAGCERSTAHDIELQYLTRPAEAWHGGRHVGLEGNEKVFHLRLRRDGGIVVAEIRSPPLHMDDGAAEFVGEVVGHERAVVLNGGWIRRGGEAVGGAELIVAAVDADHVARRIGNGRLDHR